MDLVTDFLLLAASGAACFYCWALSTRLKKLMKTNDGLGASVVALSQSAEEMKVALEQTKQSADGVKTDMDILLKSADEKADVLQKLLDQLATIRNEVVTQTESSTQDYMDKLAPFIDDANATADKLFDVIAEAKQQIASLGASIPGAAEAKATAPEPEAPPTEEASAQEPEAQAPTEEPQASEETPDEDAAEEGAMEFIELDDETDYVELDDLPDEDDNEIAPADKKAAAGA